MTGRFNSQISALQYVFYIDHLVRNCQQPVAKVCSANQITNLIVTKNLHIDQLVRNVTEQQKSTGVQQVFCKSSFGGGCELPCVGASYTDYTWLFNLFALRFILHCADLLFTFCRGDVSQFESLLPAEVDVERTYNSYCVVSMCSSVVPFLTASASFVKDSMLLSHQYKERKVRISKN